MKMIFFIKADVNYFYDLQNVCVFREKKKRQSECK